MKTEKAAIDSLIYFFMMLSFIVGIFNTSFCHAFESTEHKRMSNLAFRVALAYHKISKNNERSSDEYFSMNNLRGDFGKYDQDEKTDSKELLKLSYGDIVACVDFYLYPEKILADSWKENRNSMDATGLPIFSENNAVLDLAVSCKKNTSFANIQASHNNHSHFQHDLMMSYRLYHFSAIAAARNIDENKEKGIKKIDGNIFGAMIINAIADHYLQDYFAPGHIVTPRDSLSDVPATAMHDLANERGMYFKPENLQELLPILKFICNEKMDFLKNEDCKLRSDNDLKFLVTLLRINPGNLPDTLPPIEVGLALNRVVRNLSSANPAPILLRGDQRLWDANDSQLAQRIFMLLVQVRSILDVLESNDSFRTVEWKSGIFECDKIKNKINFLPVTAKIAFGHYLLEDKKSHFCKDSGSLPNGDLPKKDNQVVNPYPNGALYPIIGLSMHRESMSTGARAARNVYSAELLFVGVPVSANPSLFLPAFNIAPVVGFTQYGEGKIKGSGPTLRLVANIPETEITVGPYFRWLSYPSDTGRQRRFSSGFRIDSGFSSYLTLFLGVGKDSGTSHTGAIERGWMWSGGIEIAWPLSRTPLLDLRRQSGESDFSK